MKRTLLWSAAVLLTVLLTLLVFPPAAWLVPIVEERTGGRLTLGDAQGTLWRGSGFIGGAPSLTGAVTPLLAGRFNWRLSPLVLVGIVDVQLENAQALSQPVTVSGGWSRWQLSASSVALPAEGLSGLGAPLNTIAPSGKMRLTWSTLELAREDGGLAILGRTTLEMRDMASRLSSLEPLGSYDMLLDWRGQQAQLTLSTLRGAVLLSGKGALENGHFRFSGQAEAAKEYEATLGNMLNMLGQRRMVGDKKIIALEFNQ